VEKEEILEIYDKKEEIDKIVERLKKFRFEDFIKTDHFYYSLEEKNTDINFIKDNFEKFNLISLVNKRKHKNEKISYDFYYELEDGTYILYAIALDEEKPVLFNAFHVIRNFKQFRKNLIKAYKDKLIG